MTEPAYLRFPNRRGDLVTFVAEDDVWVAPTVGGRAWRVSENHAPAAGPRFSPDGSTIAWMSTSEGAPEVFCAPAAGGPRRRLTWWGAPRTTVLGWDRAGDLLVSSPAGQGAVNRRVAHRLPLAGGPSQVQPWGLVGEVALQPDGPGVLVSTPTNSEPAWRKRYRGGTASVLWLDVDGSGVFARLLPEITASLVSPMWTAGGRLAFASDHEGGGQLYSLAVPAPGAGAPAAAELARHTASDFYVRHATTDGTGAVWSSAGALWCLDDLDPASGAVPRRLDIALGGARLGRSPRRVPAAGAVVAVATDHTARASAVQLRGTIQWLAHRDGPARVLTPPESEPVRGRLPTVLGRTGRVAWVGDAGDDDGIVIATVDGSAPTRTHATGAIGTVLALAASPDGAVLAVAAHDGRLLTLDASTGAVHEVARALDGEVRDPVFSPDSRWLAWSAPGPEPLSQIRIVPLDGARPAGDVIDVTPLRFSDTSPAFSEDGRHLAFLSMRSFDPVYDTVAFDMAFVAGWRPHLVPLAAGTASPFDPSGAGLPADGRPERSAADRDTGPAAVGTGPARPSGAVGTVDPVVTSVAGDAAGPAQPAATHVDPAGLADRIRPFPVPAGVLTGLATVSGGFIWKREVPTGVLGDDRAQLSEPPPRPSLERFDLASRTVKTLTPAVDEVCVSGDGTRLVLTDGDDVIVVPADHPAPAEPEPGSSERVVLDLGRAHIQLEPAVEWRQEYGEAWRRMRDNFWRADMDGVDWVGVRARYEPLLDAIASSDDLIDLLWEVQGELATSHAYVRAPEKKDPARRQGLLGADLSRDDDGTWRVARVLPGESSDPRARSPLAAPAVAIAAGDAIVAVGGRLVDAATGPNGLLVGTVGKPVALTVGPADGSAVREVTVVPVEDETPLRYHEWVAGRRDATHELSGGRLGYVHVPDMIGSGWAQLYRDLRVESGYEGLIVDVRENRGGHTSQLVIEKIARTVVGWDHPRHMRPFRYPADAPRGPVVLVANQNSGSDGDIVNAVAQALHIGPVVGERTWGGVIGIDGKYTLVDGTVINQPRYAGWFAGKGWGIENHGVDPDVEVVLTPQDRSAGRDPQLQTAVRLALEALAETPAAAPSPLPPPTAHH